MDIEAMAQIQAERARQTGTRLPLDAEGADLAEEKRYSIDLGEYIVKTDPLR